MVFACQRSTLGSQRRCDADELTCARVHTLSKSDSPSTGVFATLEGGGEEGTKAMRIGDTSTTEAVCKKVEIGIVYLVGEVWLKSVDALLSRTASFLWGQDFELVRWWLWFSKQFLNCRCRRNGKRGLLLCLPRECPLESES
ncbi:unnamed protein product [Hydatigera taeniaeformis]|uniref:Uncharacterized protein n=1 Tax=Hydatigena taeniaeformis TaxID=6205 RepID=A0A0R3XDG0_HYDTA|nr:unnamed protein product [Hydatigera taeniaeformis]